MKFSEYPKRDKNKNLTILVVNVGGMYILKIWPSFFLIKPLWPYVFYVVMLLLFISINYYIYIHSLGIYNY